MREILFRGKSVDSGEWCYGYIFDDDIMNSERMFVGSLVVQDAENGYCDKYDVGIAFEEVVPKTIGEYAGLKDKAGKRIFEGDYCCVTKPCVLCYGKITFANGSFWFVDNGPSGMLRLSDIEPNGFEIEVRGNIHDNPELLEK